jgi:hypothetical protein
MTPNPHRGSDFADFLAEEGLTPTMTPTNELTARLREYNRWRRGDELLEQMHIADIGEMLDEAADRLEQLERELAAVTAAIHKIHPTRRGSLVDMAEDLESHRETAMNAFRLSERELAAERALADRLASALTASATWNHALPAYEVWKEARNDT